MEEKLKIEFQNIKNWLTSEKKFTFIYSLLFGIITYIIFITSNISSQDSLWFGFSYNRSGLWEVSLGRWGILLAERLTNFIVIPSIVTIINIFLISLGLVLIIDLFKIKNKLTIIICSSIIIASPSICITFTYIHTAIAYSLSFFLSICSVWFLYKYKLIGKLISLICFIFTMSLYQSYIGCFAGLNCLYFIFLILKEKENKKEILKKLLSALIIFIFGGICYYAITELIFKILNISLNSYNNANNISIKNIFLNLKDTLITTYKTFYDYYFNDNFFYNTNYRRDILWGLFSIISFIIIIIKLIINKKNIIENIIAFLLILFLPICLNIINIITGHDCSYALTVTQNILFIPFIFALIENEFNFNYILLTIISLIISLTFYIAVNVSHTVMNYTYNQSIMVTERIIDRIENLNDYTKGMPVIFAGLIDEENFPRYSNLYNYSYGFIVNNPVFHGQYESQIQTWIKFLNIYFGEQYPVVSTTWYNDIINSNEFKEMECFPSKNSVKILQNAVVVKLKKEPIKP